MVDFFKEFVIVRQAFLIVCGLASVTLILLEMPASEPILADDMKEQLPSKVEGELRLGEALQKAGDLNGAIKRFAGVVEKHPEHIPALKWLAYCLRLAGRNVDAVKPLVQIVTLEPQDTSALVDLGDACLDAGYASPHAVGAFERALEISPKLERALFGLGRAQMSLGECLAAAANFRLILEARTDCFEARHMLGDALYELGRIDEAIECFRECLAWERGDIAAGMIAVIAPGAPNLDNAAILEVRRAWDRRLAPAPKLSVRRHVTTQDRLRIGYVSSFFDKPNWMKPVWGLINHHDREAFDIHLFSDSRAGTLAQVQYGYRRHPQDQFHHVAGFSNEHISRRIAELGIDIVVDLNGYSNCERLPLFRSRPAPIVVGWFNLYATSGMECFDYLIGDDHVVKPNEERFYTEKVLRVGGTWLAFDPIENAPDVVEPPCLRKPGITFGSAASQYKITDEVVTVWSRILRKAPESSLLLKNRHLKSTATRELLRQAFEANGVSRDRIEFEGSEDYLQFLEFYGRIDIALDTFPYGGATTTTESIWQGVPVVAFDGDRWAGRLSASILRESGFGAFVASDVEGYGTLAAGLAAAQDTPGKLAQLRRTARSIIRSSRACDTQNFAQEIEGLYMKVSREVFNRGMVSTST